MSDDFEVRVRPRTLAGATILQIIPSLDEDPVARTAIDVAHALLQVGARVLIAADSGPLINEATAFGAEWIPLATATVNPLRLRRNARTIEELIEFERIDLVHAHSPGAAWSARAAADRLPVALVTSLPDVPPPASGRGASQIDALASGDRIIAPSQYAATSIMSRYDIAPDRITIIPRSINTAAFNPAAVAPERIAALRAAWHIAPSDRVIVVPGRVAPWNGQHLLPQIARLLIDEGWRDVVFAIVGEDRSHPRYARSVRKAARAQDVESSLRLTGHCADMPAAFTAGEIVAVPAIEAPMLGRVVAQAQAAARPVVTSDVGALPEHVVTPPNIPEELRTGWVVPAGNVDAFARALTRALALDASGYKAMAARARQFAEYMFSPESVAVATRAVYTSLLARAPSDRD